MWQINPTENKFCILCKTFEGLEDVLVTELEELGYTAEKLKRAVQIEGTYKDAIILNYKLRTALNVMIKIAEFTAKNPDELFKKAFDIPWHSYFSVDNTFSISHTVRSPFFSHTQFAALKVKDAVADRFKKELHKRPSVDKENPDVVIHVRITAENVSIWFDTSGKALYIRGYKKVNGPAPLNEVLCAGLIKLSGWDKKMPVLNPMCGGGTLGLEAYMMAINLAPSFNREDFAYKALPWFNAEDEAEIKKSILETQPLPENFSVLFSDNDIRAIDGVKKNARAFHGISDPCMQFVEEDFFESTPKTNEGIIFINPPYGERMQQDDLIGFYKKIGNTLKHRYAGHTAWVLSSAIEEIKHLGLRPSRKIKVFNGPLEARWLQFKMYAFNEK